MDAGEACDSVHCFLAAGCDIGLGHMTRTMAVAREFLDLGAAVTMHLQHQPSDWPYLEAFATPVHVEAWDGANLPCSARQADILLLDYRTPLPPQFWKNTAQCQIVAGLDDPSPNRLHCSILFYPPVLQLKRLDWTGFRGEMRVGWPWVALGEDLVAKKSSAARRPGPLRVLLLTGGADTLGLTPLLLRNMRPLLPEAEITVVLGPATRPETTVATAREPGPPVKLLQGIAPAEMSNLMRDSDVALSVFGVSALELVAQGIPAVLIPLNEDQAASAVILTQANAAILAPIPEGEHLALACESGARLLADLAHDRPRLIAMHRAAVDLDLGQGAKNIAQELMRLLHRRKSHEHSKHR